MRVLVLDKLSERQFAEVILDLARHVEPDRLKQKALRTRAAETFRELADLIEELP